MKFGFNEIAELGQIISEHLKKCDIKDGVFDLPITKNDFYIIDEDLYYRNNGEEKYYIPSEKEINIKFSNFTMNLKAN